jgi:hypothetical protein
MHELQKLPSFGRQEREQSLQTFEREVALPYPLAFLQRMPRLNETVPGLFETVPDMNFQFFFRAFHVGFLSPAALSPGLTPARH